MGQQQSRNHADEPLKVTKLRAELRHTKERNKMLSEERKLITEALEADLYEKQVQLFKLGKTATKYIGFRGYLRIIQKASPRPETDFMTTSPDYHKSVTTNSTAMVLRNSIMNFSFSSLFEAWLLKRTHFVHTQKNQRRLHQKGWKSIVAFYSEEIPGIQEAFLKQEPELRRRVEAGKERNMALHEAYTNHIATHEKVVLEMRLADSSANLPINDSSFESESRDPMKLRRQNSKLRIVKQRSVPVLELSDKDNDNSDWESPPFATRKTSSSRKKRGGSKKVSMTGQVVDVDADEYNDSIESIEEEEEQTPHQQSQKRLPSHRAIMISSTGNMADVGEQEDADGDSVWSDELGDDDIQHRSLPTVTVNSESEATCLSSMSAVDESTTDDDSDWGLSLEKGTRKKPPTKNEDANEGVISVDEFQSSDDDIESLDTEEKKDSEDEHLQTDAMEQIEGQGSMEYTRRELERLEREKQERLEKLRPAREAREKFYREERDRLGRKDQQLRLERMRRASIVASIRQEDHEQMGQLDHRNQDDHYEDMAPDRVELEDEEVYNSSANEYEDRVEYVDGQLVAVEERATLEAQERLRRVRAERIERERLAKEQQELEAMKDREHEEPEGEQGEVEQEGDVEEQVGQNEKEQHPPPADDVELEDLKDDRDREAAREWSHDRVESSQDGSQENEEVESLQEEIERLMELESSIHDSEHKKPKKLKKNSLGEDFDSRSTHSKRSNSSKRSTKSKKKKAKSDDCALSEKISSHKKQRRKRKESNLHEDDGATTLSTGTKKSKSSKSPKKKKKNKPSTVDVEAYPDVSKTTDSPGRVYDDDDDDNLSSVSFELADAQQGTAYEKSIKLL
jgi:hypothetical protein